MVNSKLNPYAPEWSLANHRANSSSSGTLPSVAVESNATTETRTQKLNPNAPEWSFADNRGTEQERGLFVTFSKWIPPLEESELTSFFNEKFGQECVQSVAMFNGSPNPPKCAKVVFKTKTIPNRIFENKNEVSFTVNGKTIWCKRYNPKKKCSQKD